jgi:soluble epoxide hydrolase / lipid-phosphate phosphatase
MLFPTQPENWTKTLQPYGGAESFIKSGSVDPRPSWVSEEEYDNHKRILERGGLTGPLNWYKMYIQGVDDKIEAPLSEEDKKISVPVLLINAEQDVICKPAMQTMVANTYLTNVTIETLDCGHWVMLEKPKETIEALESFARRLVST